MLQKRNRTRVSLYRQTLFNDHAFIKLNNLLKENILNKDLPVPSGDFSVFSFVSKPCQDFQLILRNLIIGCHDCLTRTMNMCLPSCFVLLTDSVISDVKDVHEEH